MAKCPCGIGKLAGKYAKCCGRFHRGAATASTPEQLMRSRYSAYALLAQQPQLTDYLLATWHPSTRPQVLASDDNPHWLQLQLVEHWQRGEQGYVHFRAFFDNGGDVDMLEERSQFVFEDQRWWYVDAI
ncbi:Zn-binding protein [Idiomarina tyrosinivorans]|uniref:Zn-binding protein n=1 Tax=Idiomarina tyrosinivorans TaxID=1445662 RepID=A0A432ZU15_9GAMM|nr:YchJ family metal-binding protein [Idiomarina tyrosinivorans]RUO81435.1 Zn-binding protein [Idiomarina tyrosinivorans]